MNTIRRLLYQLSRRYRNRHTYKCGICDGSGTVMLANELSWTFCYCCGGDGRHVKKEWS